MGYTHYWRPRMSMLSAEWDRLLPAVRAIVAHESDVLAGADGTGDPEVTDQIVCFNGRGEDSHETFVLRRDHAGFGFCKTAHKPYDLAVTAVLAVAEHVSKGGYGVSSDGGAGAWEPGVALASVALGEPVPNPRAGLSGDSWCATGSRRSRPRRSRASARSTAK